VRQCSAGLSQLDDWFAVDSDPSSGRGRTVIRLGDDLTMAWVDRRLVAVVVFVLASYGAVAGVVLVVGAAVRAQSAPPRNCGGFCYLDGLSLIYIQAVVLQVLSLGAVVSLVVVAIRRRRGAPDPEGTGELLGGAATAVAWGSLWAFAATPLLIFTAVPLTRLLA
jgi:hypothetical protein